MTDGIVPAALHVAVSIPIRTKAESMFLVSYIPSRDILRTETGVSPERMACMKNIKYPEARAHTMENPSVIDTMRTAMNDRIAIGK